ncbi:SusC/RagA family TonB-linked outer membrane protein [Ginsengibacter hankyongi]|uniref:SusC/RagA family TonB-linked outer membrane protein n=1 Tax=Ginsengibacter hankyongi TaxID=2607284 RepID=A0A5J5IIH4_9BACT|nr:SusC/RagA family TonB-linked outer membrane protein [Ginsengibacter hankyongi]KAA9040829.1 SusC/RagA family TonB-linked outer membrane protein [Ginsengibacter hankyongi]
MLIQHFKTSKIILILLLLTIAGAAQNTAKVYITIKGKVINEAGEGIPATILVKGTHKATATDADGSFSLRNVSATATLVISGINVEPLEIAVQGRSDLGMIKVNTKVIADKEITVPANTGYQTVNPNEVNGSLVVIDNKTMNEQVDPNILKRLDGVTPGLLFNIGKTGNNPQNTTNISIRGLSTINGPLDPLIVLDNFIYEGDINNINPNDIESITVLKDAAATSIYGARGGNGVIVITSKKARFNQRFKIDLNSTVTVTDRPSPGYLKQMSSADYIDVEQYIFNRGYFDDQVSSQPYQPLTPAVNIFLKRRDGLLSATDSAAQINALKSFNNTSEFEQLFYKKAVLEQYALSLSGGGKNIAWLLSGGYNRNVNYLNAKDQKANIRVENTYRPFKNFEIRAGLNYTNDNNTNGSVDYSGISVGNRSSVPYLRFADDKGNALPVSARYSKAYVDSIGQGKFADWDYYPLTDYKHDVSTKKLEDYVSNIELNYSFLHSFQLSVHYQYEKQLTTFMRNADEQSYYNRNLVNSFADVDPASGSINYIIPQGGILQTTASGLRSQNFRSQLNFTREWGLHAVSAIAGTEIREVTGDGNGATVYGYNKQPLTYASVDFYNYYPTSVTGDYENIPGSPYVTAATANRFVSLFANVSYQYKKRYSLSGSVRKDGSNIFGLKTNDKWQPLWSAGAGWVLSEEPFYKSTILPWVKLRVTYGASGNVDLSRSPLPIAYTQTNYTTNFPYSRIITINNPELKWEQSRQANFALDFKLGKELLTGTVEYYLKAGTNLYAETPYDYTTWGGYNSTIIKNVADMKGHGMDVLLHTKDIGNVIQWNSTLIVSYNQSKTTKYYSPSSQNVYSLLGGGNTIIPVTGKPLYGIVAFTWGGLDNEGNPQGYLNRKKSIDYAAIIDSSNSKQLSGGAIKYIGAATPAVFGSFINAFRWKQLSLSFNISYRFGYYFKKPVINYDALINSGIGNSDYDKRWQKPGDELTTSVPSFVYTDYPQFSNRSFFYSNAEVNILKADNVRLQYVNINYALSPGKWKHIFQAFQVYVNASNVGILWRANKEKLDPDYPNSLPAGRSYSIGLRATF